MKVELISGRCEYFIEIPEKVDIEILNPLGHPVIPDVLNAFDEALSHPLNEESLGKSLEHDCPERVAVVVADDIRPEYCEILLSSLFNRILSASPGLQPQDISILIDKGLRRRDSAPGIKALFRRLTSLGGRVISHDSVLAHMVDFGITSRGTPVRVNTEFAEADFKIVFGQIYPHQLVGFTGGAACVAIGGFAAESIAHMNRLIAEESAMLGCLETNPVRDDLAEAGRMIGIDLAISLLLNPDNKMVGLLAGSPDAVLRTGERLCTEYFGVAIESRFDIVVIACGKEEIALDRHMRQGLLVASQVVKEGGKVLILSGCSQYIGEDIIFDYICQSVSPEALIADFKACEIRLSNWEADSLRGMFSDRESDLVVGFGQEVIRKCQFRAADASAVVAEWVEAFDGRPRVAVIPDGSALFCYPA